MGKKPNTKLILRQQIIDAAKVYRDNLAGKVFLYVYGETFFEVVFYTNCFKHLTGVNSTLAASDFYAKATKSQLTTDQFFFDDKHYYANAKKKLPCLLQLPALTNSTVCVVMEMQTVTIKYDLGVTNLDFTIGFEKETTQSSGKQNDWFRPKTLRVKDHAIENSANAELIDFIFVKDASMAQYDTLTYRGTDTPPPQTIQSLLTAKLVKRLYPKQSNPE